MTEIQLIDRLRRVLDDAGLRGSFLVRDVDSGDEIAIDPDIVYPIASLVKVPLALTVSERIADGRIDGAQIIEVPPGLVTTPGPAGISRFRHPARIAIDDLLYLSTSVTDNSAADALLGVVGIAGVNATLEAAGITGISMRHGLQELAATPLERLDHREAHLGQTLAIQAGTAGRGHPLPQLDAARANSGTARAFAGLLTELWRPTRIQPAAAERVRDLMAATMTRWRLAPDFASDSSTWSSKTGTLLNLRHEAGVVEHLGGATIVVVALTESTVPASVQPAAEATMASVARRLHDRLRER